MKKINKKGFTLVELLVVIAVIGLVLGIVIFGTTDVFETAKKRSVKIDTKGVLSSAKIWSNEVSDSEWIDTGTNKYFCVTIEELKNRGLIEKKAKLEGDLSPSTYIVFEKDNATLVSDNGELLTKEKQTSGNKKWEVCSSNIIKEAVTYPELLSATSYTDELNPIKFTPGTAESGITNTICEYGNSSGKMTNTVSANENNTCKIGGLKSNQYYYVKICQETKNKSTICSTPESYKTAKINKPNITINNAELKIKYNDGVVINGKDKPYGHYFTSTLQGTSNEGVQACTLSNNIPDCSGRTDITEIQKNTWYKTTSDEISINYTTPGEAKIIARITDKSNNYSETSKTFKIFAIKYYLGTGLQSTTTEVKQLGEDLCIKDQDCTLKEFSTLGGIFPYSTADKNANGKTDYKWAFYGWGTSINTTTREYTNGEKFKYNNSDTLSLYAIGSRKIYFNSGIAPKQILETKTSYWNPSKTTNVSTVDIPKQTNITGWTFLGYIGGDSSTTNENVSIPSSKVDTSYAIPYNVYQYMRSKYKRTVTINYKANGGSGTTTPTTITQIYNSGYGNSAGSANNGANINKETTNLASNNFTNNGYAFNKWAEGSTSGTKYEQGGSYNLPKVNVNTTSINMYAIWNTNAATIKFKPNGGNLTASTTTADGGVYKWKLDSDGYINRTGLNNSTYALLTQKYTHGTTSTDLANYNNSKYLNITRTGYHAVSGAEWKCESGCTTSGKTFDQTKTYTAADFCNINNGDCIVTLNVNWSINTYTVKYDGNGNTGGSTTNSSHTYGTASNLRANGFTKTGYTFTGWNTKADGKGTGYADNASVTSLTSTNGGTITLYAQWKVNVATIKFKPNGGNLTASTTTADGGVYKWKLDSDGYINRTGLNNSTYALLTQKYTHGTTSTDLANYNNSKYLNITRTGYNVPSGEEWICLSGCTKSGKTFSHSTDYVSTDFCDTGKGDCTVVLGVNWKIITYNITYDPNGGSFSLTTPSTTWDYGTTDEIKLTTTNPTKSNNVFVGWYATATNFSKLADLSSLDATKIMKSGSTWNGSRTKNTTLYAIWAPIEDYDIPKEENIIIPLTATYKLEAWGAQGGSGHYGSSTGGRGGYGGYTRRTMSLTKAKKLYINVGGKGYEYKDGTKTPSTKGGYNGGGAAKNIPSCTKKGIVANKTYDNCSCGGGGGATHIATKSGLLSTLSSYTNKILLIAGGGGGGSTTYDGGDAGGFVGNKGVPSVIDYLAKDKTYLSAGTRSSGYKFGQGADGGKKTGAAFPYGGGGSGRYGGNNTGNDNGNDPPLFSDYPGAGGSGYLGDNDSLINGVMYCFGCSDSLTASLKDNTIDLIKDNTNVTLIASESAIADSVKIGNGHARITFVELP